MPSKVVGRPFKPGQSGNPGGRPKSADDVRNLAREHSPRALQRLIELVESDDERIALMAAKEVLDRGYGKPKPEAPEDDKSLTVNIVKFGEHLDDAPKGACGEQEPGSFKQGQY